jgi:hypothetical protein
MSTHQQLPYLWADRHTTTKHVRKSRRVRFSPRRTSPVQSTSSPTTECHTTALRRASESFPSMQYTFSIDPSCSPGYGQVWVHQASHRSHSRTELQYGSMVSSRSNSGNTRWSGSNCPPSSEYTTTDTSCLGTPDLTVSDTASSSRDPKYATRHSTGSSDSEWPASDSDEIISGQGGSSIHHTGERPILWIDTTFEGTVGEFCYSPIESGPKDEFPRSEAEEADTAQMADNMVLAKSQTHVASHHCVAGLAESCSRCLDDLEACFASNVAPEPSLEDQVVFNEQSARCCQCHFLLTRPTFDSPGSAAILDFCALYPRQIKKTRQTMLRRLQDMFEFEWQRVRRAMPCLEKCVPQTFSLLDIIPTLQEGLRTLEMLLTRNPPSSQGYLSLAIFTKAWLSLQEQPGLSEITTALFVETAHWTAAMTRPADRPAYDLLLQLLWRPLAAMTSPSEAHPLFCPTYIPTSARSSKDGTGTKSTSRAHPKLVLSHVCCGIVQGKVAESMSKCMPDWKTELISQSPKFGTIGTLELLPPSVRNTPADYTIKKITWLIAAIEQSRNGGQVIECSQCHKRFTGPDCVRNCNRHLSKTCKVTQERPDYQRVKCPYEGCGQTCSRSDNVNQHVKRKHHTI